jgi:hypothetical protein
MNVHHSRLRCRLQGSNHLCFPVYNWQVLALCTCAKKYLPKTQYQIGYILFLTFVYVNVSQLGTMCWLFYSHKIGYILFELPGLKGLTYYEDRKAKFRNGSKRMPPRITVFKSILPAFQHLNNHIISPWAEVLNAATADENGWLIVQFLYLLQQTRMMMQKYVHLRFIRIIVSPSTSVGFRCSNTLIASTGVYLSNRNLNRQEVVEIFKFVRHATVFTSSFFSSSGSIRSPGSPESSEWL